MLNYVRGVIHMTIKEMIRRKKEERAKIKEKKIIAKANLIYEKYMAKSMFLLSETPLKSANYIIEQAKKLEGDLKNGKIKSILDYEERYYDLSQDIKRLNDLKHEDDMWFLDIISLKGLTEEQKGKISAIHSQISYYLSNQLSRAMTATRNCEYTRMKIFEKRI